jgi:hypothetical protein
MVVIMVVPVLGAVSMVVAVVVVMPVTMIIVRTVSLPLEVVQLLVQQFIRKL